MADEIHPGSFVGDSVEEFKKLPTWGKFGVGLIILLVAYLAYRASQSAKTSTSGASVASGTSTGATDTSGGALSGASGGSSPFSLVPTTAGNGTSVPVIPFGDTPIFDQLGQLIGWQQPKAPTPTVSGTPVPTPAPAPTPTPAPKGGPVSGMPKVAGPIVTNPGNHTSAPAPKISTYTVVRGDNLSSIAARLGVSGGWQAIYAVPQNKATIGGNPNLIYAGQKLVIPGR